MHNDRFIPIFAISKWEPLPTWIVHAPLYGSSPWVVSCVRWLVAPESGHHALPVYFVFVGNETMLAWGSVGWGITTVSWAGLATSW